MDTSDQMALQILKPLLRSAPIFTRYVMVRQMCLPPLSKVFVSLSSDILSTSRKTNDAVFNGMVCIVEHGPESREASKVLARGKTYHARLDRVSQQDFSASMAVVVTSVEDWIQRVHRRTISQNDSRVLAEFFHRVGIKIGIVGLPRESVAEYRELLSVYQSKTREGNFEDCRVLLQAARESAIQDRGRIFPMFEYWLIRSLLDTESREILGISSTWNPPGWLIRRAFQLANYARAH